MKKKFSSFKVGFCAYIALLVILVAAALFYVSGVLEDYEAAVPENVLVKAFLELQMDEWDGTESFWEKYNLPEVSPGRLEGSFDVKEEYVKRLTEDGAAEFAEKKGNTDPDKLVYIYSKNGVDAAEITLRATSESMTKLAILTYRTWEVESIKPILEKKEYTLIVPTEFTVRINGLELTEGEIVSQNETETSYNTGGLYLLPEVEITDGNGDKVTYQIANGQIVAEFYYYTLTLPSTLMVELNGQMVEGTMQDDFVQYQVKELTKPQLVIKDYYGNSFAYEGGNEIPLTYLQIKADSRYKVLVQDKQVPADAVMISENPEFQVLADYVPNLPVIHTYDIAVLSADAKVQVVNQDNIAVDMEKGKTFYDFVGQAGIMGDVPRDVAAQIDVLAVAQEWSLFMSNDRSFEDIAGYMVKDCYQYQVAKKYANSVDRKFFSSHTLLDPAFTDNKVQNFMWIADNCFSVDVSFVKHMALKSGKKVDDDMNDRFFFVKWDDTEDDVENPTWKIVSMKEIVNYEK